jgi:hypothetical protein
LPESESKTFEKHVKLSASGNLAMGSTERKSFEKQVKLVFSISE